MLTLAASAYEFKTSGVLHITHPQMTKSPLVGKVIANIHSTNSQIVQAGIHILTAPRFNSFSTVVIHDCEFKYLHDYLRRLTDLAPRLREMINDPKRNLVIVGNSLGLCGPHVLFIPPTGHIYYNQKIKHSEIDDTSVGLKLTSSRWNAITPEQLKDDAYVRVLKYAAIRQPIYLLDMSAVYTADNKVRFGKLYRVTPRAVETIAQLPEALTVADQQTRKDRFLHSGGFIYRDQLTTEEKKQEEATESKPTTETERKKPI